MSKRILMLGLVLIAVSSTGCFPRIRQCIANRWQMHHGGYGACGTPCCTPAFKVPAQAAHFPQPGCCGDAPGIPVLHGPTLIQPGAGTPTIGAPMPLLNGTPNPMPGKN